MNNRNRLVESALIFVLMLCILLLARSLIYGQDLRNDYMQNASACAVSYSFDTGTASRIILALGAAKTRVRVAIYSFTNPALTDALIAAHARSVDVQLKADYSQSQGLTQKTQLKRLTDAGIMATVSKLKRTLHDKFIVIDGTVTETGSYNYSRQAEMQNEENSVIVQCKDVAEAFEKQWDKIQ